VVHCGIIRGCLGCGDPWVFLIVFSLFMWMIYGVLNVIYVESCVVHSLHYLHV
jgi:hypothetical protein